MKDVERYTCANCGHLIEDHDAVTRKGTRYCLRCKGTCWPAVRKLGPK